MIEFDKELLKREIDELDLKLFELQQEICAEKKSQKDSLMASLRIAQLDALRTYRNVLALIVSIKIVDANENT